MNILKLALLLAVCSVAWGGTINQSSFCQVGPTSQSLVGSCYITTPRTHAETIILLFGELDTALGAVASVGVNPYAFGSSEYWAEEALTGSATASAAVRRAATYYFSELPGMGTVSLQFLSGFGVGSFVYPSFGRGSLMIGRAVFDVRDVGLGTITMPIQLDQPLEIILDLYVLSAVAFAAETRRGQWEFRLIGIKITDSNGAVVEVSTTPEPSTAVMLGMAVLGFVARCLFAREPSLTKWQDVGRWGCGEGKEMNLP